MRNKSILILLINMIVFTTALNAQSRVTIRGTVFDTSNVYSIPDVMVYSTSGAETTTDSMGGYRILVNETDSIYFYYNNKNSIKYPVKDIFNYEDFNIAIHAPVKSKYKILQGVTVFSDTYRMDSIENREKYSKVFGSTKPGLSIGIGPNEVPGIDIGSIVEIFQFKKNKRRSSFLQRLLVEEQDGYVDYRFNKRLITRITGLTGKNLDDYIYVYRPTYEFVSQSTLTEFYEYIIESGKEFRKRFRIE